MSKLKLNINVENINVFLDRPYESIEDSQEEDFSEEEALEDAPTIEGIFSVLEELAKRQGGGEAKRGMCKHKLGLDLIAGADTLKSDSDFRIFALSIAKGDPDMIIERLKLNEEGKEGGFENADAIAIAKGWKAQHRK